MSQPSTDTESTTPVDTPDSQPADLEADDAKRIAAEAAREGMHPDAWRYQRRNFRFGVANGIIFNVGDSFISPGVVLPWFISRLSSSNVLVGMAPAIATAGWLLPQLFIASRVQHLPRKMPWYARTGVARTIAIGATALLTLLLADHPAALLPAFFTFYTVYALGSGVSSIPWLEIVGKTVPPRRRGTFFAMRNFWGGALALLASTLVGYILAQGDVGGSLLSFPNNFALLFAFTALCTGAGVWAWSRVREPAVVAATERTTIWAAIKRGPQIVRQDSNYRSFFLARMLLSMAAISDPFYVVFAKDRLGAPAETVGLFLAAVTVSGVLSNLVWSPLPGRMSPRLLMRVRVVSSLVIPLTALLVPLALAAVGLLANPQFPGYLAFALVFAMQGFAGAGANIVNNNMLLEIAPPAERPVYIGFMNTVLGIGTLVPILGGTLVDSFGFEPVFLLSAMLVAGAFVVTGGLRDAKRLIM